MKKALRVISELYVESQENLAYFETDFCRKDKSNSFLK